MNIRLNALGLGVFFALTSFLAHPVMADEWNKRIEFQFSNPVEIPGNVLTPGKYVFQLVDSESDRNTVQVFSEDSNGKDTLVATVMAIPDYMANTPDKPIIHFDERPAGTPEAIHSWFYPGDNTGWEFVYPKGETQTGANTPTSAPVTTAATTSLPEAPQVQAAKPDSEELAAGEEEVTIAQNDAPAPPATQESASSPAPEADAQNSADVPMLPATAGYSALALMAGMAMLGCGIAAMLASRLKSRA